MLVIRCMLYKPFHVYTTFLIVNSTIALNQSLICIIGLCLDCEVYLKACIDPRLLCDHNPCTQFSCSSTYNTQLIICNTPPTWEFTQQHQLQSLPLSGSPTPSMSPRETTATMSVNQMREVYTLMCSLSTASSLSLVPVSLQVLLRNLHQLQS